MRGTAFHVHDQSWVEGQITPLAGVYSDVTGPLMESVCGSKYVLHFTCTCTKWSWEEVITRKSDILEAYLKFSNWISTMGYTAKIMRVDTESMF